MTELAGGTVPSAFDRVARSYDLMVALSPGYHAQLRSSARALVEAPPDAGPTPPGARSWRSRSSATTSRATGRAGWR